MYVVGESQTLTTSTTTKTTTTTISQLLLTHFDQTLNVGFWDQQQQQ